MSFLKPNGLFCAYKRAVLKPSGLFVAYKRALRPNGLSGIAKKSFVPTQFGWEEIGDYTQGDKVDDDKDKEYFNYVEDINDYDFDEDH